MNPPGVGESDRARQIPPPVLGEVPMLPVVEVVVVRRVILDSFRPAVLVPPPPLVPPAVPLVVAILFFRLDSSPIRSMFSPLVSRPSVTLPEPKLPPVPGSGASSSIFPIRALSFDRGRNGSRPPAPVTVST